MLGIGVMADPTWFGTLCFAAVAILLGLFFAGVDTDPIEKVVISIATMTKMLGTGVLISGILILLGSPVATHALIGGAAAPNPTAMWVGTLLAFFGIFDITTGTVMEKGGDNKPLSTLIAIAFVFIVAYAFMCFKGMALPGDAGELMKDFFVVLIIIGVGCLLAFLGLRGIPAIAGKIGGWFFVATGIYLLYIVIKYLWLFSFKPLLPS